jgi:hypothetical protein
MSTQPEVFSRLSSYQLQFLRRISEDGVRYLVVGGYAVRYHGYLRPTKDLDLFVDRSLRNVEELCRSLSELGADNIEAVREHLLQPRKKATWDDVELLTTMEGLEFDELFQDRVLASIGDFEVPIMSRRHLIQAKRIALADPDRSASSDVDLQDLRALLGPEGDVA